LAEAGFPPLKAVGMGIRANLEIGSITPPEIVKFVESQIGGCAPDCVFLSCTNWRAIEAIDLLQRILGIPVVSSNKAAIDMIRQAAAKRLAAVSEMER
jgi:maleate isomerase